MPTPRGRWLVAALLLAAVAGAQPLPRIPDDTKAQARGSFEEGIRYFNVGDYAPSRWFVFGVRADLSIIHVDNGNIVAAGLMATVGLP